MFCDALTGPWLTCCDFQPGGFHKPIHFMVWHQASRSSGFKLTDEGDGLSMSCSFGPAQSSQQLSFLFLKRITLCEFDRIGMTG